MEKIYEEQQFNPKRKQFNFSIVLSFVIALFAIGSLVAVGFNQISYAAGEGETFTLTIDEVALVAESSGGSAFQVPLFYTMDGTTKVPVFCVQQGVSANNGGTYASGETPSYSDIGLSYILTKYYNGTIVDSDGLSAFSATYADYIKRYVTQVAIWLYLDETTDASDPRHGNLTDADRAVLKGSVRLDWKNVDANQRETIVTDGTTVLYTDYIAGIVAEAKTQTIARTVEAKFASTNIDKISNGEIYQTSEIGVVADPSDKLVRFYVQLEGMPDAYVVNKAGERVDSLTPFNPTDKFYIRVPVDKVTEENKTVDLKISGDFNDITLGEFYTCGSSQQIIRISPQYPRVDNVQKVNFLVSPDTGMTTAQTIYFIGLIVLLCGVGIIYANAKPIEE